jgi:hypothetical protein
MMFLYDLPDWLMALAIVAAILGFALGGFYAFHRFWRPSFTDEQRSVAMTVLTVVATINALLLAFVAVSVWEAFGEAEAAVVNEANVVGELARDLAVFDSVPARDARRLLRDYATTVVSEEWPAMRRGEGSAPAWDRFDRVFAAVGGLEPDTTRRQVLLAEIWARTNELLKQRRTRLHASGSEVPLTLWIVVLIGTALTIGSMFALPPTRFNFAMVGMVAVSSALVFHIIAAMDRPFAGEESVSSAPFQSAVENMKLWDRDIAKQPAVESASK